MSHSETHLPYHNQTAQPRGFSFGLGLAPKLLGAVALLGVLSGGIATGAGSMLSRQTNEMGKLAAVGERGILLGRLNGNLLGWVRGVEYLPLELKTEERRHWEASATEELESLERRIEELRPALTIPENRRDLQAVEADVRAYKAVHEKVQALSRAGKLDEATSVAVAAGKDMEAAAKRVREMQLRVSTRMTEAKAGAEEFAASAWNWLLFGSLGGIALGLGLALLIVLRGVTGPLRRLTAAAGALGEGQIDTPTEGTGRGDEVGAIARALEALREKAQRARVLEHEAEQARAGAEAARLQQQRALADRVERELGAVVQGLSATVGTLEGGIATVGRSAEGTAERAASVAAGATQATNNVQTVAAAAEELASSVNEITRQVGQAAEVTRRAVQNTQEAEGTVGSLSEAAQKIGDVVRLIGDIAGQTNLLALNATIEAARAGETGKGFAVVASEVKALAGQTAKATEEIGQQIAAIKSATERAVASINAIVEVVAEVNGISATIAAAVEEQGAATREIARNVAEAAQGTNDVSANIAHVSAAVEETTGALQGLRQATAVVAEQGGTLREGLAGLLRGLRTA